MRIPSSVGLVLGVVLLAAGCEEAKPRAKAPDKPAASAILPGEAIERTKQGDAAKLKAMVEENPSIATGRDDEGLTLLFYAASSGKADVVATLLAAKADPNAADEKGVTPLHVAAEAGHAEVVKALLAKGADPNAKTREGVTPLHAAVDHLAGLPVHPGCVEVVKLLIAAKADVNAKGKQGATPLHITAQRGHKDIAELLLAAKADPNAKSNADDYEWTPLHRAAAYDRQGVAELLLAKGADINAKDMHGRTPLACARHMRHRELADFLRQKGAKE